MKHKRVVSNGPLSCRTTPQREVCIAPCKNSPLVQCLCIVELVPKSTMKLFPRKHMRKTLASILSVKATMVIKRIKDCEHTSPCVNQRKRRAENLSRFHSTPPVIFELVIRVSNMVGLSQNLTSSFLA